MTRRPGRRDVPPSVSSLRRPSWNSRMPATTPASSARVPGTPRVRRPARDAGRGMEGGAVRAGRPGRDGVRLHRRRAAPQGRLARDRPLRRLVGGRRRPDVAPGRPRRPGLHLISNGKATTGDDLRFLAEHGVHLMLSLPGIESYAEHTGGGDPDRVLALFEDAARIGLSTTVGVTITRRNLHETYTDHRARIPRGRREPSPQPVPSGWPGARQPARALPRRLGRETHAG